MTTHDCRQLAGQLMMIRLFGTQLDQDTADFIRTNRIGGACLFRQNMLDAAQLTSFTGALREAMGEHALIALDQEGGAVVRALWVPPPPSRKYWIGSTTSGLWPDCETEIASRFSDERGALYRVTSDIGKDVTRRPMRAMIR